MTHWNQKHGYARLGRITSIYRSWLSAKARCHTPTSTQFPFYGGRGITMCQEWRDDFMAFLRDVGEKPSGATLERIDNDGHYEPGNVRWATKAEQTRNTRRNVRLTIMGQTRVMSEWARLVGASPSMIFLRLRKGWTPERAVFYGLMAWRPRGRGPRGVPALFGLLVLLLSAASAFAQAGFIQAVPGTARPACTSITAPVAGQTWCADASGMPNTFLWKVWNGTTYVTVGGGGGGGSAIALNNQTWAAFPNQFFGNDANVTISSAGGVHTLGWAGCLPVSRGGIGLCSGIEGFLPFFDTNSSIGMSILQQTGANTITVHPGSSAVQTIQAHFSGGGAGAALLVKGGDADSGSGAVGGELALRGGDPDGAAAGGAVEINGRPGTPGGNVTSRAGNSTTGQGGLWIGTAGDSAAGIGGDSFLTGGNGIGARGGNVVILPGGGTPSGNVIINGLKYPLTDGTPGQSIVTDGAGVLSFASGGTGTVTGSGTPNTLPIWTGASALGDSGVTDDGTTVVVGSTGGTFDNLTINEGGLDGSHFGNRNLGGIDTQAVGEQIDLSASSSSQYLGNQITDTGSTNNGVGSQITASGSNNVFLGQVLNDGGLGTVTLIGQGFDLTGEDPLLNSSIVMGEAQADLAISTGSIWLGPVGTRPDLRFYDNNGVAGLKWVGFQAPPVVTTSVSWLLPVADGGNGDCLVTDGAGQLAFSNACAGGGGITSLNGLSAAVQTVAPGSTNINWSSAVATHTFTWTGQLSAARGGTGQDTSAWSALPLVTAGVWSQYAGSSCPGGQAATSISASGVLTCAGAGTGNVTHTGALTAGVPVVGNGGADIKSQPGNLTNSVYFASGSGQLAQSVNFFYNSGSNALFLNAPSAAASWGTPSIFAATAAAVGSNVGATGPLLNLASSNGTIASPTASATTNLLGTVDFRGFDGTNSVSGATIKTVVQSAVSSGIIPTNMVFTTTDIGGAKHDALTLRNNGNVILGGKLIGYAGFGATDGALLIGNGSGGRWDANTLTAGTGITITNGPGTIRIDSTATGVAGTSGQVQFNNSGIFGADSNFFWDNATKRLGLGTSSPTTQLQMTGTQTIAGQIISTNSRPLFINGFDGANTAWIRAGNVNDDNNLAIGILNEGPGTGPGEGRAYYFFQPPATALKPRGGTTMHLFGTYWTGSAARTLSHAHEVVMIGPTGGAATTDQDAEYQWEVEGSGIFGGATGGLIRFRWDGMPTTNASIKTHDNDASTIRFKTSQIGGGGPYVEVANMASELWNFTKAVNFTTNNVQNQLTINNTTPAGFGANIKLVGDGGTPAKFIRSAGGNFQVINDGYSTLLFNLTDSGVGTTPAAVGVLGDNSQQVVMRRQTQLVSVANGVSTQVTTIQIPPDAVIWAVPVRVTVQPGGTSTMTVTATTSGTVFQKGASISTSANTTDPGTKNVPTSYNGTGAQTITFTFNTPTTNNLGRIRVDIIYLESTPPSS